MNEPEKPKKGWGCLQLIVDIVTLFFSGLYWMSGLADMGDFHDGADLSLEEEQRSVVHLHMWEEMTFRESGELLGQSTQTLASRYRYI